MGEVSILHRPPLVDSSPGLFCLLENVFLREDLEFPEVLAGFLTRTSELAGALDSSGSWLRTDLRSFEMGTSTRGADTS